MQCDPRSCVVDHAQGPACGRARRGRLCCTRNGTASVLGVSAAVRLKRGSTMMTLPELAANALEEFLGSYMRRRFGSLQSRLAELVPATARVALECIGNSDARYHNVEHTLLVTLAAHEILRGRALHIHVTPNDYAHVIIACLLHDIGYVRGLFENEDDEFVDDDADQKVVLPRGASDAGLMPYHVDRSKLV